jgi:hypothetical protein
VDDAQEIPVDQIELYLPSSISLRGLQVQCDIRLLRIEHEMRRAQADDALQAMRDNFRLRSHVQQAKWRSHRGQHSNTRSQGMIAGLNGKINAAALKYRQARATLFILASALGEDVPEKEFPVLEEKDIAPLVDDSESQYAKDRRKKEKVAKRRTVNEKDSDKTVKNGISWIWKRLGLAAVDGDELLQEGKSSQSIQSTNNNNFEHRSTH